MHISALSIALLSATMLAAPVDINDASLPSSSADNSTSTFSSSTLDKRDLRAYLSSWQKDDCRLNDIEADDRSRIVGDHCVKYDLREQYVKIIFSAKTTLKAFKKGDCTGNIEQKIEGGKDEIKCVKRSEKHWGSVIISPRA